jgi:hypothetical protein
VKFPDRVTYSLKVEGDPFFEQDEQGRVKLSNFLLRHDLSLQVTQNIETHQYMADLCRQDCSADIQGGGLLQGAFGAGRTADEALKDLFATIEGCEIVFRATSPDMRYEVRVPQLADAVFEQEAAHDAH